MSTKVSVLMSTHARNYGDEYCSNLLRRALDSVLAQTFKNFEFIIIDDASSDGTSRVLKKYQKKDSRIKIFRFEESCKGNTAKRYNFAALQGSGEWFAYMFDDDEWEPNHLETLLLASRIEGVTPAMIYGMAGIVRTENSNLPPLVMGHVWNENILRYNFVPNLAVLLHRNTYILLGGSDENPKMRRYSDWEYWRRIYRAGLPVAFVPQIVATVYEGKKDSLRKTVEAVEFSNYNLEEQIIPDMSKLKER